MTAKFLVNIVGPTAIGKTALSIQLAQHFQTEILSSDSRQFYKEMSIGTAVPSPNELSAAQHHFIQNLSVTEDYSVGQFEKDAITLLNKLYKKHDLVILVGGSGLYTKAIIDGLDAFPDIDNGIRLNLNRDLKNKGLSHLQEQLKQIDRESFESIDINNSQRVIRALEVSIGTGKPYSSFKTSSSKERNFKVIHIGLMAERTELYERINNRVDLMVSNGLIDEAKSLLQYRSYNALNTVGYKELFGYFDGDFELDFAVSEIKKNTRRFAKRQLTWYRKNKQITWFHYQQNTSKIIRHVEEQKKAKSKRT